MRRPSPPPPPRHAQRRRFVPEGRRELILGLSLGATLAAGFLTVWAVNGAPL